MALIEDLERRLAEQGEHTITRDDAAFHPVAL